MNQLTLDWIEAGQLKQQVLSDQKTTKIPGTTRIGRDATQSDIVIADMTVAPCHVEIFFNPQQQCFYLRNLRETNPPIVNGMLLRQGDAMLDEGSTIQLGAIALQISTIALGKTAPPPPSSGYTPTSYATQVAQPTTPPTVAATNYQQTPPPNPPPQPTVQPTIAVSPAYQQPPNPTPVTTPKSNRTPLILGISAAVLTAAVAGIVITLMPKPSQVTPNAAQSPASAPNTASTPSPLLQAKDAEKEGNLGRAIELAKSATGTELSEAQSLIAQWQPQWDQEQAAFQQVKDAYNAGRWQETSDLAYNSIPRNPYWDDNSELTNMAKAAEAQLASIRKAEEQAKADAIRKSEEQAKTNVQTTKPLTDSERAAEERDPVHRKIMEDCRKYGPPCY